MKLAIRFALLFVMVVLLVSAPGLTVSHAQGATDACKGMTIQGLTADDCALFQTAAAGIQDMTGFTADYSVSLDAKGVPGGKDGSASSKGTIAIDFGQKISAMKSSSSSGSTASNATNVKLSGTVTYNVQSSAMTQSDNLSIMASDGIFYWKGDKLTNGKWKKISASSMQSMGSSLSGMAGGTSSNPASGIMSNPKVSGLLSDPAVLPAIMSIPTIPGFIVASHGDDLTIDGTKTTQIIFTFDLQKLINAPQILPLIKAAIKSNTGATDVSDADVQKYVTAASNATKGTTADIRVFVGSDKTFRGFAINFGVKFDASALAGVAGSNATGGDAGSTASTGPTTVNFSLTLQLSKLNQPVTVTVPTDAVDVGAGAGGAGGLGGGAVPTMAATQAQ